MFQYDCVCGNHDNIPDKLVARMSLSRHHNSSIEIAKNCACFINHRNLCVCRVLGCVPIHKHTIVIIITGAVTFR